MIFIHNSNIQFPFTLTIATQKNRSVSIQMTVHLYQAAKNCCFVLSIFRSPALWSWHDLKTPPTAVLLSSLNRPRLKMTIYIWYIGSCTLPLHILTDSPASSPAAFSRSVSDIQFVTKILMSTTSNACRASQSGDGGHKWKMFRVRCVTLFNFDKYKYVCCEMETSEMK